MSSRLRPAFLDYTVLASVSSVVLCHEIVLLRVFAYSQWHHFASLAVSLALLGFAGAGTLLSVLGNKPARRPEGILTAGLLTGAIGMLITWGLLLSIRVRPLFAAWDPGELGKLLLLDFAAFIPFLGLALCICLAFIRWPGHSRSLYAANLLGSGFGALAASVLLSIACLETVLLISPLVLLSLLAGYLRLRLRAGLPAAAGCGAAALILALLIIGPPQIPVSDFKRIAYLLDLPDRKILDRLPGLRSELTLIRSESLRLTTGLSLRWTEPVPASDAIVLGTDRVIPITRRETANELADFRKARLGGLSLQLRPSGTAVLLGTSEWLTPEDLGTRPSVWVEPDKRIRKLFMDRISPHTAEACNWGERNFLSRSSGTYPLILLASAYPEGEAVSEDYQLTREAIQAILGRLDEGGLLAIPVQLTYPPRNGIRLLATVLDALRGSGMKEPLLHLAFLRTLQEGLVLVGRDPLSGEDIRRIRIFANDWEFDLSVLPGLQQQEVNTYHVLPEAVYWESTRVMGGEGGILPQSANWYIRDPATDARPYFWHSMQWRHLPDLLGEFGRSGLIWLDWSLLMTAVKLGVAAVLSILLVLLPLRCLPSKPDGWSRLGILFYFGAIGTGFMLIEMAAFQRCVLFLHDPVITAALVFTVFLVGAGLGSMTPPSGSGRRGPWILFVLILAAATLAYTLLTFAGGAILRLSHGLLVPVLVLILAPLAWAMGKAFPWGLTEIRDSGNHIPWAWGINGFASILAAPIATLVSVQSGQALTWGLGSACYLLAWITAAIRSRTICK